MIFSLIGILGYACLRSGIYNLLRYRKHSRSFIKKHLEGKKRFWLYEKINKLSPLGIWYHFNKAYLIYASAYFVATLSLAHIDVLHIPFIILSAVFGIMMCVAVVFDAFYEAHLEYGRFPIVCQKRNGGIDKYYSSFPYLIIILMPITLIAIMFVYI